MNTPTTTVLSAHEQALLTAALNQILPAHGDLAAAGELGVGQLIDQELATTPSLRRLFHAGLALIDSGPADQSHPGFLTLTAEQQTEQLSLVEKAQPVFFATLVNRAYRGYYGLPAVQAALGQARPPQPGGRELPRFNSAELDRASRRAPFWRRT